MRHLVIFMASLFFLIGTVTEERAHAFEAPVAGMDPAIAFEADSPAQAQTSAKASGDHAPDTDKQSSEKFHGCHGHHSGVTADYATGAIRLAFSSRRFPPRSAALPPAAVFGTFRPPIA